MYFLIGNILKQNQNVGQWCTKILQFKLEILLAMECQMFPPIHLFPHTYLIKILSQCTKQTIILSHLQHIISFI